MDRDHWSRPAHVPARAPRASSSVQRCSPRESSFPVAEDSMSSSARSTIERLIETVAEQKDIEKPRRYSKLSRFLYKERGFREQQIIHSQSPYPAWYYLLGRRFETAEEVDEWLCYFFLEKNQSLSDPHDEMFKRSPLHCAARFGDFACLIWLVEHGALLNTKDEFGETPLMSACTSLIDAPLKVRCLAEAGADCLAQGSNGAMALSCAVSLNSEQSESVQRDLVQYLIFEKGLDVNHTYSEGMTVLLHACCSMYPHYGVIQKLLELGADVSVRTIVNRTVLHIVAARNYLNYNDPSRPHVIDLLIQNGADITCKDKDGKLAHELARNENIGKILRQHYDGVRFSVLRREMVRPDAIKLCVIGSVMAGKTTLVNSLLQLNCLPIDPKDRTAGIEIHRVHLPGVGKVTIWDFGAQLTFHSAHGLFFRRSNTVFVLVLPIRKEDTSEESLLVEGRYWCAFSKASLRPLPMQSASLIHLFIVFNLIDLSEEARIEMSFKLNRVFETLQCEFGDTFQVSHVVEMDCSQSQSAGMTDCRNRLRSVREEMLEAADEVPKLCQALEEYVSLPDEKRKAPLPYFVTAEEFRKWVAAEVGVDLSEDESKVAVEFLDLSGIIIDLGRRICVRPPWLCHNVIGPLLAPRYFPFGLPREKFGRASAEDIDSTLKAFRHYLKTKGISSPYVVTSDEAIEIFLFLELCITVETDAPKVYQIPALLEDSISPDAWDEQSTMNVYRGQRYECDHHVDIISPSSFVLLQCRCFRLPNTGHEVWKDCIKLVRIIGHKVVECLVRLGVKKSRHCIDVILRWSGKDQCEDVAKKFLDELKSMIAQACSERSPGISLNWFYIDSSHLRRLDEDPAIYSAVDVDQKVDEMAFGDLVFSSRPKRSHRSSIRDLVIVEEDYSKVMVASADLVRCASGSFPNDDVLVPDALMRACAAVSPSKWEELGILLGIASTNLDEFGESTKSNLARMFKVLESWKKAAQSPTVRQLLSKFKRVGVSREAIIEEFKEF